MSLPPINSKKKKKKSSRKKKDQKEEDKISTLPKENMFALMERRGVYASKKEEDAMRGSTVKKKSGHERNSTLKDIKKSQKKSHKKNTKKNKELKKNEWDDESSKRARMKKTARMIDQLDVNCDENGKKKNKAARRRQRMLQLQSLKAGNGPANMPIPEKEPEPEPEPEIPVVKPPEEEEQISSDEEEKTYAYEGDDTKQKYKRMKRLLDSGSVPEEMQKKNGP